MLSIVKPWIQQLANTALQRTFPCRLAETPRERDAIARLRYAVHVVEQNVTLPEADHARGAVWYPDDEGPDTLHFYVGSADEMLGALRVRVWAPGQIPAEFRELYSTDLLPGIEALTVCDVTKMMVVPRLRATAAMASLSGNSIYTTVSRYRNAAMLACCAPGLLRSFRSIGLRTFGGRMRHSARGLTIPLVGITHDVEHTYQLGSPWYPALRRLQNEGLLPEDVPAFRALAERDRSALTDARDVQPELERFAAQGACRFVADLSAGALAALGRHAMVLDVPADVCLARQGVAERELFVVLSGELAAARDGGAPRPLGTGDVVGHAQLLGENVRRSEEVRALTPSRVLVVRRKVLAELDRSDPEIGRALRAAIEHDAARVTAA